MIVIGIDPGTRHLGWGIIQCVGTRLQHIAHGVVHTDTTASLAYRLVEIDSELQRVIDEHHPCEGAVEAIFYAKDPQAANKLGHARGVALLRLARANVDIYEYAAKQVKNAVAGRGQATKDQVGFMVKALLGLSSVPQVDAADALAIAITHANISRVTRALKAGRVVALR